jgi:hypothetical protein
MKNKNCILSNMWNFGIWILLDLSRFKIKE